MSSRLCPTIVAGHYVRSPSLVSVGCDKRRMVYAVSASMIASVDVSDNPNAIFPFSCKGSPGVYVSVEHPSEEAISFICVHPQKDLLCVGTENHGLYLTEASHPRLCNETRLPHDVTGERTHSGCFLHVPAAPKQAVGPAAASTTRAGYAAPLQRHQVPPPPNPSASTKDGTTTTSTTSAAALAQEEDLLVFSSTFNGKKGPSPHRLSLYTLRERCLLWRGAMDPLGSISAFPSEWAFAACTRSKVSLFNVQWATPPSLDASQDSQPGAKRSQNRSRNSRATLLSRLCNTVDDLRDAEYVRCVTDCHGDRKESLLVALTSHGYMVSFDKETGAVVRWMDCKVCPAHSVQYAGPHVLIIGSMLRFFHAETWEFCGKVKLDVPSSLASSSYLGKSLSSSYTAAVGVSETAVALFSGSGEAFVYRVAKATGAETSPGKGSESTSKKVQLLQVFYYAPPAATEGRFLWAHPALAVMGTSSRAGTAAAAAAARAPDVAEQGQVLPSWCLWSPAAIRVFSARFGVRKALIKDSTCATYHSPSQVLLVYDSSSHEVAAYAAGDDWRAGGRMDHSEPLTCLAASATSDLCAGYSERANTLTVFSCAWTGSQEGSGKVRSLVMQRSWTMTLSRFTNAPPVQQLFFLGGSKVLALTSQSLVDTDTGTEHPLSWEGEGEGESLCQVIKACPVGRDVVLLYKDRCAYYIPESGALRTLPLTCNGGGVAGENSDAPRVTDALDTQGEGLVDLAYEPVCDLVAVCDAHRVLVMRLLDNAVITVVAHDTNTPREGRASAANHNVLNSVPHRQEIKSLALRVGATGVLLTVIDSMGHITEYTLEDKKIELNTASSRGATPRTARRTTTPPPRSAAAQPTNNRPTPAGKGRLAASSPAQPLARGAAAAHSPAAVPSATGAKTKPTAPRTRGRGLPESARKAAGKGRAKTVAAKTDRKPRLRAVSAQAPSNRELSDRLEALSGYYEQQKVHAQQLPPRTPRRGSAPNTVRESTPDFPQTATPCTSLEATYVDPCDGGGMPRDSPPSPRTRTAKRGGASSHAEAEAAAAAGAGTSIAVSALTMPSSSADGGGDEWGSSSEGRGRHQPQGSGAVQEGQPQPCDQSPTRRGDLPPDTFVPYSEDEAVVYSSAVPGRAAPQSPREFRDDLEGGGSGQPRRLTALRDSLLHLKDMLENGSDNVADLADSADAEELPSLLDAVAEAMRQWNARRSGPSHSSPTSSGTMQRGPRTAAGTHPSDSSAPHGAEPTSYQFLFTELQRIQKQNERLEEQNRAIMDRLGSSPARES